MEQKNTANQNNSFLKNYPFLYSGFKASLSGLGAYMISCFLNGKKSPSNRFFKDILKSPYVYFAMSFSFSYDLGKFFVKGYCEQNSQNFLCFLLDLCKSVIWKNNIDQKDEGIISQLKELKLGIFRAEQRYGQNEGHLVERESEENLKFSPSFSKNNEEKIPEMQDVKSRLVSLEENVKNKRRLVEPASDEKKALEIKRLENQTKISDFIETGARFSEKDKLDQINIKIFSVTRKSTYVLSKKYIEGFNFPAKKIFIMNYTLEFPKELRQYQKKTSDIVYLFVDLERQQEESFIDSMIKGIVVKNLVEFVKKHDNEKRLRDSSSCMYLIPLFYHKEPLEEGGTKIISLEKHFVRFDSESLQRHRICHIESLNFCEEEGRRGNHIGMYLQRDFGSDEMYYLLDS